MAKGRKPARPQALRANIYKTHKAASLAGRKPSSWRALARCLVDAWSPKKMCKFLTKFAKIYATVKQLAGNKREKIMVKKLLDTAKVSGNTKVAKTGKKGLPFGGKVRMAQLSMMPDNTLCAGSKAAGCMDLCLKDAGLAAVYRSVNLARQARTDFWHADREGFLSQLRRELANFAKLCDKQGVKGVVRLNVLSDIAWEEYDIPQDFPTLYFYDYTKRAKRLGKDKTPANYDLMFSYSARHQYRKQVLMAVCHDNPIAVVFKSKMPDTFLGRDVIDGDQSDLTNVHAGKVVIGLKVKGPAKHDTSGFVVDANVIPSFTVEA